MVEGPACEAPSAVTAGEAPGDISVVFEFMEIADDCGASDFSLQSGDQVGGAEAAAVSGQGDHDGELDAVHAHTDQSVQFDGERGVRIGRHPAIVSAVRGKE